MAACSQDPFTFFDDDGSDSYCDHTPFTPILSQKEVFMRDTFSNAPVIEWHHIPFSFTHCVPLGCTDSHVFAMIKDGHEHFLVCSHLRSKQMMTPFMSLYSDTPFVSPWRKRMEGFPNFLGGCAHGEFACVVTSHATMVFSSVWRMPLLNSELPFSKVYSCDMNDEFLVVAGVAGDTAIRRTGVTGHTARDNQKGAVLVFRWRVSSVPIIKKPLIRNFHSVTMSKYCNDTMFVVTRSAATTEDPVCAYSISHPYEHQHGMFKVLDSEGEEEQPWTLTFLKRLVLSSTFNNVAFVKELGPASIVQSSADTVIGMFENNRIRARKIEEAKIVDIVAILHGITVLHDSSNALHFYDCLEREVYVVTNDSIMEPFLNDLVRREKMFPERPYRSLGFCSDSARSLALFLNAGALVVINF